MKEFKVKFRGVRGSYPITKKEFLKYGGNTACVEISVGGNLIILDAGTGIIELGNELMCDYINSSTDKKNRKSINAVVLLSHIHQDHIQGFTFFNPLHLKTSKIDVFGMSDFDEDLAQEFSTLLFGKSFPLDLADIACNIDIHNIQDTDCIVLKKGELPVVKRVENGEEIKPQGEDVVITCYKSPAHPQNGVLIYKIGYKNKSVVYATDKESYEGGDKKLAKFARGCDLLIHDAQYLTEDYLDVYAPKQGYGHSTFDMAIKAQKQAKAAKLVFYHYDPSYNDKKLDKIKDEYCKDENVVMAHEGLEIKLL